MPDVADPTLDVASLGLLYVTFSQGEDSIMVPNNVVLTSAVAAVNLKPGDDQRALEAMAEAGARLGLVVISA